MLANIYLHYTLDLWFEKRVKQQSQGYVKLIRYADDYVACFQYAEEARQFMQDMTQRLNQFHLELAPEKSKCFSFGRYAQSNAKAKDRKVETFDFLGLTHYCSRTRDGKRFRMKRKTVSKRFTAKLKVYKEWLKANRTLSTGEIMRKTATKLQGHYGYYGVTDNSKSIQNFAYRVTQLLFKWLNRRGKRGCYTWEKFWKLLELYPLPKPRIKVNLLSRLT